MKMESTQSVAPQTTTTTEPPPLVRLSDKAAAMVKETIERENLQGSGLRVAVVGGGCSGTASTSRRSSARATWCSR
jgi:hypothetical protein